MLKGTGSVIGLTHDPESHIKWSLYGPILNHLITEFEGETTAARKTNTKIFERGVKTAKSPAMTLMWPTSSVSLGSQDFWPNHFVVLYDQRPTTTAMVLPVTVFHATAMVPPATVFPATVPYTTPELN